MKNDRITRGVARGVKIAMVALVATFGLGFIIMYLWNWLMPGLFGLHPIRFPQALGLFLLCKLLFGGFHRHGGRGRWREHMTERWERMTPEERERLREGMRGRGCRPWGSSKVEAEQHAR